ncbi:MAG: double-strand break repair protein AddB [Rhizomicrobium sp.]
MSGVFTIPAGAPFGEWLANGLMARSEKGAFALADVTIYLPTRRAARNFGDSFARVLGGATLLPQFRALGESEDEDFDDLPEGLEIAPAISPIRRQLLLTSLIRCWEENRGIDIGFAHAMALAESLASVMDEAERQEADLAGLAELAPLPLAAHWEEVTRFLTLIRDQWPSLLMAEKALNPAARRKLVLDALAQRLKTHPPPGPVIAAGSTGSIPATARLLAVIARMRQGALVLPGLDRDLDEKSWQELDPGHFQYGLKILLDAIGEERGVVKDWHRACPHPARETLIRESLRPAPTTDAWRALAGGRGGNLSDGLAGMALVAATDPAAEALAIALALRETLEHEGKSAALVTPDRTLARRVAAEMRRWGIAIDDSAGRPLAHTPAGAFLCLMAEAADADFAPVSLLGLLKHPFAALDMKPQAFRAHVRSLDRLALRGPRPDPGLSGITRRAHLAAKEARSPEQREAGAKMMAWWQKISECLAPLERAFAKSEIFLDEMIAVHLDTAQRLGGENPIWRDVDGEAAALFFARFRDDAANLPPFEPHAYPSLLRAFAMTIPVRPAYGTHSGIGILGPLEARLQNFDLTILGGLNEGTWPQKAATDPWFSRPMRKKLGLEQPERAIGLAAHDFAMLATGRQVLLTRAARVEGVPAVASRWLTRLDQLTKGLGLKIPESPFARWAPALSEVVHLPSAPPPMPRPPMAARPRKLSVTEIETWLRDPYAIYARHVLELDPLDPLDAAIGPLERGIALHKALEIYKQRFPGMPQGNGIEELLAIADDVFGELAIPQAMLAVWRPRFENAARWFVGFEQRRTADTARSAVEISGAKIFPAPGGDFTLTAKADRIDILKNGKAVILDYKSGKPPTAAQVRDLLTPQLPLEGAILEAGGFAGLDKSAVEDLIYIRVSGSGEGGSTQPLADVPQLIEKAMAALQARIVIFDDPETPYPSRVQPFRVDSVGDYDHLARVRAWAVAGWEEE